MTKRWLSILWLLFALSVRLPGEIYRLSITGPIESITEEYVRDSIALAHKAGDASLILIEIDTPGGIETSMRTIIKEIIASPAPIAVYVSPKGARAASAGFLIVISADIAAMAPGTNMGAAHPVNITGSPMDETMTEKVTNDSASYARSLAKMRNRNQDLSENAVRKSKSYTAEECLQNGLAEYIAPDLNALLLQLDGKEIRRANGASLTLTLKNQRFTFLEMSPRQKFLKTITNPNLAYFLLIFGLIGLYLEFSHPGAILPGVLGGISLLLAFLAFQILPVNYIGLMLILLAIGFFIAEIKIQGFGALGAGGVAAFVLGSIILIDSPLPEMRPALNTIITLAVAFSALLIFLTFKVFHAMKQKTETGREGLIGEIGVTRTPVSPQGGTVFIHGEWWNAVSDDPIPENTPIIALSMQNFILKIKKKD